MQRVIILTMILGLIGCSSDPTILATEPSLAIVYGTIVDDNGIEVYNARVAVTAYLGNCNPLFDWQAGVGHTDENGFYRLVMEYLHVRAEKACLSVHASPPAGSGLQETTVAGAEVTFIHQPYTPPVDSVEVNISLEAVK